jgi:hypothetical protein
VFSLGTNQSRLCRIDVFGSMYKSMEQGPRPNPRPRRAETIFMRYPGRTFSGCRARHPMLKKLLNTRS